MNKFTSYSKSSKKEKKRIDAMKRNIWSVSPITRVPPNPKAYNRNQEKQKFQKEDFD